MFKAVQRQNAMTLWVGVILFVLLVGLPLTKAEAADIDQFAGIYKGSAEVTNVDGTSAPRDLSVEIEITRKGFNVNWETITYKLDGRVKEARFSIEFLASKRPNQFSAAMGRDIFGHAVQLDPMRGDPYVWAHIDGKTLTVYSLFIGEDGGYEMQEYARTLVDGGLELDFERIRNGERMKTVKTILLRQ